MSTSGSTPITMSSAGAAGAPPPSVEPAGGSFASVKGQSLWQESFNRLKKNRVAVVSMVYIIIMCFVALFAVQLSPYPFDEQNMDEFLEGVSTKHLLGTDHLGRDLFSRLIYGARMSMAVGIIASLLSLVIGGIFGAIAGWFGGVIDGIMMRTVDLIVSVPTLVLMILVMVVFQSLSLFEGSVELEALVGILLALSLTGWTGLARLVRGQVLQVKQMQYVEASRALGVGNVRIMLWHIFPNILGPIVVMLTYLIPANVLFESFLSFIGLGLKPPFSSWGTLVNDGWKAFPDYIHLTIFPGAAIFITMLAFNIFGDGLRDAFDPKMKNR